MKFYVDLEEVRKSENLSILSEPYHIYFLEHNRRPNPNQNNFIQQQPQGYNNFQGPQNFGGPQNYGQSSSAANANAYSNNFGPNGFGSSAANAQAQGFESSGPLGSFGASAANANSQSFQAGPNGINGAASLSGSQTYKLPTGQNINVAYSNGLSFNNGQGSGSNSHSITYSK
jgi:hypothetical protein